MLGETLFVHLKEVRKAALCTKRACCLSIPYLAHTFNHSGHNTTSFFDKDMLERLLGELRVALCG